MSEGELKSSETEEVRPLREEFACPACDGGGFTIRPLPKDGKPDWEQCGDCCGTGISVYSIEVALEAGRREVEILEKRVKELQDAAEDAFGWVCNFPTAYKVEEGMALHALADGITDFDRLVFPATEEQKTAAIKRIGDVVWDSERPFHPAGSGEEKEG